MKECRPCDPESGIEPDSLAQFARLLVVVAAASAAGAQGLPDDFLFS
jgi:hypothetical protein